MFGLSASHLIILGIVVLLFGARRLPEVGASMGSALRAFKSAMDGQSTSDFQKIENAQRTLPGEAEPGSGNEFEKKKVT